MIDRGGDLIFPDSYSHAEHGEIEHDERDLEPSFKLEVIADSSGQWAGNAMRYATRSQAEAAARGLMARWMLVREWRVVESDDAVNVDEDGRLI